LFKDLYKKANDTIPTEDAYLRVMEKVNAQPQKTKYGYTKYIAVAACFILMVSVVSVFRSMSPDNNSPRGTQLSQVAEAGFVKNPNIPDGFGTAIVRMMPEGETVTAEDYCQYIGKDIVNSVVLPKEFENYSMPDAVLCFEEGEAFNDKWTYNFSSDSGAVYISTTKKTDEVAAIIFNSDYQKSNVLGTDIVVFDDGFQKIACFTISDVAYTVTGMEISDDVFGNVVISLLK